MKFDVTNSEPALCRANVSQRQTTEQYYAIPNTEYQSWKPKKTA